MQNPPLTAAGQQPVPMNGEIFMLSRSGISFTAKSGRYKFDAKGDLYLSTLRLVFVSKGNRDFQGFDIPIATLAEESFNQPIFGANNLSGASPPLEGTGLTETIKWCIYFNNGGVGTFLPLFFRILSEMRSRVAQPAVGADGISAATTEQILQAAYVDPNDPSKLYVSQPIPTA